MNTDEAPPELPAGALVQSLVVDADGRRAGYRIFADGRYQTLPRGGGWSDTTPLDASRLATIERALDQVPLDDLAGRYEADTGETEPNVLWFQVARDGSTRTVSVVGSRRVPELERLTALLTDAFR
jgi:hypothetical protein